MQTTMIGFALGAALGALLLFSPPAASQGDEMDPARMKKAMERWMAMLEPGDMHKTMEKFLGRWSTVMVSGMGTAAGESVFTWAVKGRVMIGRHSSSFQGKPTEAVSLSTWDPMKKKWVDCHASTMHYGLLWAEGVVVDKTHRIRVTYGAMDEVLSGEHDKAVKYVTRWIDNDTFVHEVWDLGIGESGAKVVTTTYKRKRKK